LVYKEWNALLHGEKFAAWLESVETAAKKNRRRKAVP
jgi:hypothetical protein